MHVTGVVLAAGRSTRMGRPKQLIEIDGLPLVAHAVRAALSSNMDEVVVVTGAEYERVVAAVRSVAPHCRIVENRDYASGLSTSVRAGIRSAPADSDAVAILLGDEPAVEADVIDAVVDAFGKSSAPAGRALYRDGHGGRKPGHPVLIRRVLWGLVADLTGDEGARRLLASAENVLDVPVDALAPADLDTPEDLAAFKKSARAGAGP